MDLVQSALFLVLGIVLGGAAAWLLLRAKIGEASQRAKGEAEAEKAMLAERVEGRQQALSELSQKLEQREQEILALQNAAADGKAKAAHLEAILQAERRQAEEKIALVNEAQRKLSDAFKALASDALKSNNQSFLELAKATLEKTQETAKGDLDKRQQAIQDLVKPVRESLDKVDAKIGEIEKVRVGAYEGLKQHLQSLAETQNTLRSETSNLVRALRAPQVRGRWGEIQLKRVVEMAGMLDHCDFYEQQSADTEDGRLRPDLLVCLPGNKNIVVDAKAPLAAYLESLECQDDATRTAKLRDHAQQIRNHIAALSKKSYWEQFQPAPEFVVLFLPGETFFSAALEQDPALIEVGVDQRVILATPTTLIALLRAVSYGWRQEHLAQNAQDISELGKELYKRLADLGGHMGKLGRSLTGAIESYNKAVGTLESRVLVSARRFKDLHTTTAGVEIDEVTPVEHSPRALQAPELSAAPDDVPSQPDREPSAELPRE
ncbi:MAG: DNA recombination protein RmuC [Pirellulales bacterium]